MCNIQLNVIEKIDLISKNKNNNIIMYYDTAQLYTLYRVVPCLEFEMETIITLKEGFFVIFDNEKYFKMT